MPAAPTRPRRSAPPRPVVNLNSPEEQKRLRYEGYSASLYAMMSEVRKHDHDAVLGDMLAIPFVIVGERLGHVKPSKT